MGRLRLSGVVRPQRRRGRGFTLFEFAVVASIFAVLITVALERVAYYRHAGDEAAVQALLINMRSALSGKVMALQAQGREQEIDALAGANPVTWLERVPNNYVGELTDGAAKSVKAGNWYFDPTQQKLIFVRGEQGNLLNGASKNICFKVELLRLPSKNANAERQPGNDPGVALIEVPE
ncbi:MULTISPECIES: Tfp pilus assembly protein FimT/FimU [unclassified Duganella]|uniref:pilus assembly FimT family protein n=1 Tax=unclassified Duganella TaxID=2636909 RepID=UPI001E53C58A|nr:MULTISPECIES: prepilin-type N-terminal cleavage/methylation domain-containing protein [unclassified Duganella]